MKISTKARYGLKAMCYLADNYKKHSIPLSVMSNDLGLSEKYLEQLMSVLRKANFVQATRGTNGGYFLDKDPKDIYVGDLLRVLEDGLVIVDCINSGCPNRCNCKTFDVWDRLNHSINDFLDKISLQSLVEKK